MCAKSNCRPELSFCYGHSHTSTRKIASMLDGRPRSVERRFPKLRAFCPARRDSDVQRVGLGGGVDLVAQVDVLSAAPYGVSRTKNPLTVSMH